MSIPTLTVRTGVGLALLPCVGQPENFTPDTFTLLPGAAVSGLTENTGTLHEADGLGTVVAAAGGRRHQPDGTSTGTPQKAHQEAAFVSLTAGPPATPPASGTLEPTSTSCSGTRRTGRQAGRGGRRARVGPRPPSVDPVDHMWPRPRAWRSDVRLL